MSKRRTFLIIVILLAWLCMLPLWLIGLGYGSHRFRLPMIGRDHITDIVIFYVPIFAVLAMLVRPIADRFRTGGPKPPVS